MSALEIVDVEPQGLEAFVTTSLDMWGEPVPAGDAAAIGSVLDRSHLARLDGVDAGTAAVIDFQLTLPGGGRVAMDGVTWVVVSSVARRRGVLRALMEHMLEGARQRGTPLLGLGASESSIYRRFGYGVASHIAVTEIDTVHAGLRDPAHSAGRLRRVVPGDAVPLFVTVDSGQPERTGAINRSPASWRRAVASAAESRGDTGPLQVVVHEDPAGVVDGFVTYRTEWRWPGELADSVAHVRDFSACNLEAHVDLWQHVLSLDLVEHVRMERGWLDDPIRHLLADSRRLRQQVRDDLHLRVVDVAAVLGARRYAREDTLVLEVRDPRCPALIGRYRVEGGLEGAHAAATQSDADLVLDGPSVAALLLGDVSAASLHRAGLIDELRAGAARRAAAMFSWSPRPWLNYMF